MNQNTITLTRSYILEKLTAFLLFLCFFIIPIEHKYDKPLRHFSLKIIPEGLLLPAGFDQKIYFYPSDIIALILFLSLVFVFRIPLRKIIFEKASACLFLIFSCALISILNSPYFHYVTIYTRLVQLLTPIFLFAFLTQVSLTEKQVRMLLYCIVAAAMIQSVIAITQYFTQEYLGLRLLSETRDAPATFPVVGGKRWIFDAISESTIAIKRSSGTFPHSNVLGGFLMMSVIASYSLIVQAKRKLFLALCLIVQCFALCLTFSRSAIFGVSLATLVWFSWTYFKTKSCNRFLIKALVLSFAICAFTLFDQYLQRGGIVNYNLTAQNSDEVRLVAQSTAIEMIKDHPATGVGFQQFSSVAEKYGNKIGTHNIYLFICSEMGIIALFAFLGFIALVLKKAGVAPYTPEIASLFAIFVGFLFIGGCDFYPITFQQGKLMFFTTAGLLCRK